jgi:hypothetical protein
MVSNLISGTLSEADQAAVLAAITTIREKIPFLLSLTPDQRRELVKNLGANGFQRQVILAPHPRTARFS